MNRRERREAVKDYDLVALAEELGFTPIRVGHDYISLEEHDSVMIRISTNTFRRFSSDSGGDPVAFLMEFGEEMRSPKFKSVDYCLMWLEKRMNIYTEHTHRRETYKKEKPQFRLPVKGDDYRRLYAYLTKTRGIDSDIVNAFTKKKLIYQEHYKKNIVFVGYDYNFENPKPVYAMQRSTLINNRFMQEMSGNNYDYGFSYINRSPDDENLYKKTVIVTESAIDMMSVMCLFNNGINIASYLSLGGVEKDNCLYKYLEHFDKTTKVILCLDNDEAGRNATKRIEEQLKEKYPHVTVDTSFVPRNKDFNEDLIEKKEFEKYITIHALSTVEDKEDFLNYCKGKKEFSTLLDTIKETYRDKEKHKEAIENLKDFLVNSRYDMLMLQIQMDNQLLKLLDKIQELG